MSNSSLVTYKAISPNCTIPRKGTIQHVVIHHMAGNCTIETCGQIFAPTSRQASSHYGVGSDGRIGQYCYEENRAWTTGNAIDHKSVTIEVADEQNTAPWSTSAKALQSTIKLVADICRRNGIEKCTYTGDGSGVLLKHCWYQSTDCPGDYLGSKFSYIADEVNKLLGVSTSGWNKDNKGWWYKLSDGSYYKACWKQINGSWYCFDNYGYAVCNKWIKYKNEWYYLDADCKMKTGWLQYKDNWYYLQSNGAMAHDTVLTLTYKGKRSAFGFMGDGRMITAVDENGVCE